MTKTRDRLTLALSLTLMLTPACAGQPKTRSSVLTTLPQSTTAVVGFSTESLRQSPIWTQLARPAIENLADGALAEIQQVCGIDVLGDLQQLVISTESFEDDDKILIWVKGNWNKAKVHECLLAMGQKKGSELGIRDEGKLTILAERGENVGYLSWVAEDTVLLHADNESRAYLSGVLEGKKLADNPTMMALLAKVDLRATAWGAMLIPASMAGEFDELPAPPTGMFGSLHVAKTLTGHIGMRFAEALGATKAVEMLEKEIDGAKSVPAVSGFLAAIELRANGLDAVAELKLDETLFNQLVELIRQGLFGMFGGASVEPPTPAEPMEPTGQPLTAPAPTEE